MKAAKQRAATPASRPRHWSALAAIFVLTLLAYSNSFQSGFVLDNKPLILGDARLHAATAENVARLFEHSYWWPIGEAGIHRPITKLTFLFNYAILGNQDLPAGYHAVNFLLHFANVLLVYLLGGGACAGLVFAVAVVSIPMILDRDTDAISAAITSLQVVFGNTLVMLLWGALITFLVILALLPWAVGLLVIGPWLGHASWHAYRGSVRWSAAQGPVPTV